VAAGAIVVMVVVAASIGALVGTGGSGTPVGLRDFTIQMPHRLTAGVHTLTLTNDGPSAHELVIFRTDLDAADLPLDSNGDVDEESPELRVVADSGADLHEGETRSITTKALSPGHYVAVCNLTGHYQFGMTLNLDVG
jgi:hypothetical protein